ncbi:MAG: MutS-related protein, partial [Thermoplasmata archaeon]
AFGDSPCFTDLNLNPWIEALVQGREEYDLAEFLRQPLPTIPGVLYRQEVFQDLEIAPVRELFDAFASAMKTTRLDLGRSERVAPGDQSARWFADAVAVYCDAVHSLSENLGRLEVRSHGLRQFAEFLAGYVTSEPFRRISEEVHRVQRGLEDSPYELLLDGSRITVRKFAGEPDYSAEIEATFARFQGGPAKDYRAAHHDDLYMNHIELAIQERVAAQYPEVFAHLRAVPTRCAGFIDPTVRRFERELQLYLAYLDHIRPLRAAGLPFCYPTLRADSLEVHAHGTFDLVLAKRIVQELGRVVLNDIDLRAPERILVVSGPNQGGKSTFARMFGQIHYLASLGLAVPARAAELVLPDRIYTLFERAEHIENLRGKLQDELVRLHEILENATGRSVVVLNETFTTTTVSDARFLGAEILERIRARGSIAVYVTFIDELSEVSEATVSMVSSVSPTDSSVRTFEIQRRPADGRAYARAIAEKHGLTYPRLKERIGR